MSYTTIDDSSEFFQIKVYAGTSGLNIPVTHTNDGNSDLQPDLIWGKDIAATYGHYVCDSTRGRSKYLYPDVVNAEYTTDAAGNDIVSFDTDGFKVGAPSAANSTNGGNTNKVAFQWKSNGGTTSSFNESSNDPGGTIQTNTTAGFSIISYTGTGGPGNLAHGLPSAPEWIIFKNRGTTNVWATWHVSLGDDYKLELNSNNAKDSDGSFMNSTLPTSTNIRVGDSNNPNTNADAGNYICYAWSPIQGYSKFGQYSGNYSTTAANSSHEYTSPYDGPFIYCGFKPAWVMIKRIDSANNWTIFDNARGAIEAQGNVLNNYLRADTEVANVHHYYTGIDTVSNGFKIRGYDGNINGYGTYIYMAFAESPFVTSTKTPTTAR